MKPHPWSKYATKRGPMFEVLDQVTCTMSEVADVGTIQRILLTENGWSYVVRYANGVTDTWAQILLAPAPVQRS